MNAAACSHILPFVRVGIHWRDYSAGSLDRKDVSAGFLPQRPEIYQTGTPDATEVVGTPTKGEYP